MSKIEKLLQRRGLVANKIREELSSMFPEGSIVDVFLNSKQKNPSRVTVAGWTSEGYVKVRLSPTQRKPYGHYKDVFWSRVRTVPITEWMLVK